MNSVPPPVFASRTEIAAVVLLLALSLAVWLYQLNVPAVAGTMAEKWRLTIFSEPRQQSELTRPPENRLIITGKLGPAEIEWDDRGSVRIASSTCPCKTCVNMGWSTDASLICVPNGIMVEPLRNDVAAVDAVTR